MSPSTVAPVPELPFAVAPPFPPGDPRWRELAFLRMGPPGDRVWRRMDKFGRRARRAGTRNSPLAFAYVYLARTLKPVQPLLLDDTPDPSVPPAVSFSEFHLALCEEAKRWKEPGGRRTGVIAPRGAGKSSWLYQILPLWALAHGHRSYFIGYAHSNGQAVSMLDKLRRHLTHNRLLLFDFPELVIPQGARNNSQIVDTASGRSFATSGIDRVSLGAKNIDDFRPDLITIDDGEPDEGNYAKDGKSTRLKTIRDIVLPMNPLAVVLMSGTVVMPNSIGHDLVKAALGEPTEDWVTEERFRALYFNAILDDGGNRRSLWPSKWSLPWLEEECQRNPVQYALHYANQPATRGGRYWQAEDFRRNPHFPRDHHVMWIDPAVVPKEGRDKTAVVVVGANFSRDWAVVESAKQGHLTMAEVGDRIARYKRNHPEITLLDVWIEKNNGGELFLEIIEPRIQMVPGIRLHLAHSGREMSATGERGKMARVEAAYAYYEAGRVWHARPFPELEALLTAWPRVSEHSRDLPDALAGALRKVFTK